MLAWTRSSSCADHACVEVAPVDAEFVAVRDSKNPEQPFLTFTREAWSQFQDDVVAGRVDLR
ncbi:DUF397 domain-containing protein [Actinoplanes sp. DH11]|uniref:DUF397 domain-containing protein n=1 Tax=Actinoplanes sp. DH11 TaxID=2857011 RepID=UPI001E56EFE9|nr:DUF397 domain-containing protein [Actinoplanes sp. DH11]